MRRADPDIVESVRNDRLDCRTSCVGGKAVNGDAAVDEVVHVVREAYDNKRLIRKSRWLWSREVAGRLMDSNEANSKIFNGKKGGWQP